MIVPLPLSTSDPGRRLRQIADRTVEEKMRPHRSLGTVLRSRIVRKALLKIAVDHPVSVTTADVPGSAAAGLPGRRAAARSVSRVAAHLPDPARRWCAVLRRAVQRLRDR